MAENFRHEDRCRFELDVEGSVAFVTANRRRRSRFSILRCRRNWAGEESARSWVARPSKLCGQYRNLPQD
jgi:hypothetical protein